MGSMEILQTDSASKSVSKPAVIGLGITGVDNVSRSTPESLQSLRGKLTGDDVIEMFEYQNGVTEFGPMVAIRPCRTDNLRFTRFIVNAGTTDRPHHKIIKGTELCPGGAEALSKEKNKETNFNYRTRKELMRNTPGYLKTVGPCAVMPRPEGYAPRSGSKPRRPDTYIRVMYKDRQEEWLTRTEYVQLVGQSCAERHLKALVAKYQTRSNYMDECKKATLHPGTGLPLTQKDREEAPWLFPDEHKTGSFNVASSQDADDDIDGGFQEPTIDDGGAPDAESPYINPFKKARAYLPDSICSDEEL
ncbi:hypothetical protein EJ02DRAFT_494717 [Clathrospora elynae]|uniref:Uncharacterized protein n=1 Tax=Clathrospora elynae TaxID=706981 RepID=A0A6A5SIJ0_9PLEO|nr:hypothetical protein EJ02DRAFT_494717 [Clathrospora elynae]